MRLSLAAVAAGIHLVPLGASLPLVSMDAERAACPGQCSAL
jgi:hypothetical protein